LQRANVFQERQMNDTRWKSWRVAGLSVLLGMSACNWERGRVGELRTDAQSVKLGQAKSVSVELSMGAGVLNVKGDATDLMQGTFTYNVSAWKPKISYSESDSRGKLTIEQPGGPHSQGGDTTYTWDVQLNNKVPIELHVELGAGRSDLELGDLSLTRLHVEMGAGESIVDLAVNWKHDVDAHIEGGVGRATIRLPRSVGVRATVEGGLGSVSAPDFKKQGEAFVNEEFGKSPVTVNVKVEGGIGKVVLELSGGPTV
jgi:hypothetical protein